MVHVTGCGSTADVAVADGTVDVHLHLRPELCPFQQHQRLSAPWCVYLLYFLSRCMRPEGPWQRLAAALSGNSSFPVPIHDRILSPTAMGYTGQPFLLLPGASWCVQSRRRRGDSWSCTNSRQRYLRRGPSRKHSPREICQLCRGKKMRGA